MRIAVDTNRYTDFVAGDPTAIDVIKRASEIVFPFIVLGELRAGFLKGNRAAKNEQVLSKVLASPKVGVAYADETTTRHYASLLHYLTKIGEKIPANDIWIAALVEQHALTLFTRDHHFDRLPQLARA